MSRPSEATATAAAPGRKQSRPPSRSRAVWLIALIIVVALIAGLLRWATRPQQIASLLLSQASRATGLKITASGVSEYRLRGMPAVVLRDVVAQRAGDPTPVLRAERVELTVPWGTLRSRGRELVVHHVELQAPQIDIAAVDRWLKTRPTTGETRIPTLTDGFVARRARLIGAAWTIESLDIDVPSIAPAQPVRGRLRGRVVAGSTSMPFDLRATLSRPAAGAGLGAVGHVDVVRPDWRMGLDLTLGARPDLSHGIELKHMAMGANALYGGGTNRIAFVLGTGGELSYRGGLLIEPFALVLKQGREIPDLVGRGRLAWANDLQLALAGDIAQWPRGWPTLPPPINRPTGKVPFNLRYAGPIDFSGVSDLQLRNGATRFDGRFHLPRILQWLDAPVNGTPIPPLDGRIVTPRLDAAGATLEGVDIQIVDDAR